MLRTEGKKQSCVVMEKILLEEKNQMAIEQTLSMIKPDGVSRRLIGEVIGRFERAGLKIKAMKMLHLTKDTGSKVLCGASGKKFF